MAGAVVEGRVFPDMTKAEIAAGIPLGVVAAALFAKVGFIPYNCGGYPGGY